jgi:hypothetical protein
VVLHACTQIPQIGTAQGYQHYCATEKGTDGASYSVPNANIVPSRYTLNVVSSYLYKVQGFVQ